MEINFIRILFIFAAIFTGIVGFLLNFVEPYLPVALTRAYRYGKFSDNTYQPIVMKAELPKRWFKHFYIFAAPASSYALYLVLYKYLWKGDISKNVLWVLNICLGTNRQPLVSPENTFAAALLITLHSWKRFYETHYVNIFSNKMMNIAHYIIGFYHYVGIIISIIGESEGFVEGSEGYFSYKKITYIQIICGAIIIVSSYVQLEANYILSSLRKDKNGEMNSAVYKIPHGGLFEYVSGALQLTEIIIYITMSVILWQSSTFHYATMWVLVNQISTAVLTHKWYTKTFQHYPQFRKILLPYIF
ncbi:PREDICTED: polyprenol reductase [Dufourea novaeangliae]|uniref:Polyprenal reductase n=1 Tax=Dufourea novaeangliae TaxID=178035 RepID=A0A154PPZ9_DUFNO|nr:PREDICTED: polyprenol reductase [Dufourea novaeangliae]KZC13962.1 putative polyprenol reductase [Dufourea novaeangliae]